MLYNHKNKNKIQGKTFNEKKKNLYTIYCAQSVQCCTVKTELSIIG